MAPLSAGDARPSSTTWMLRLVLLLLFLASCGAPPAPAPRDPFEGFGTKTPVPPRKVDFWDEPPPPPAPIPRLSLGMVPQVAERNIGRVVISPDGQYALTGAGEGEALLWDLRSGLIVR